MVELKNRQLMPEEGIFYGLIWDFFPTEPRISCDGQPYLATTAKCPTSRPSQGFASGPVNVFIVGSSVYNGVPSGSVVALGSVTLTENGPAVTVGTAVISFDSAGVLHIGSSAITLTSSGTNSNSQASSTHASSVKVIPSNAASKSSTGPAASPASSVNSSQPQPTNTQVVTLGSQSDTVVLETAALLIGSVTLSEGQSPVTIDSTPVSLGSSGVLVYGSIRKTV